MYNVQIKDNRVSW